jgi:hypothetical protein
MSLFSRQRSNAGFWAFNAGLVLDPDFEHLTYGDQGQRAAQIKQKLGPGDLLVFYAGLCNDFPAIKTVVERLRRGHRVNHSSQLRDELIKLKELVWSKHRTMILGSPIEHDLTQLCNRGTPSLQCG